MKPPPFEYSEPRDHEEVLRLLAELGAEAKILAGGQSLVPMLNFRLLKPAHLVDINKVAGLSFIEAKANELVIGSMTRQRAVELSAQVRDKCPLLYAAMPHIAHFQIRNRGTIGGSLAHADPAAELPAVLMALRGKVVLRSAQGDRVLAAEDFYVDYLTTALRPDELMTEVHLPQQSGRVGIAFKEFSRRHGDFALAAAAVSVSLDESGRCSNARIVLAGVHSVPYQNESLERALVGSSLGRAECEEAARLLTRDLNPQTDLHASSEYRKELATALAARALREATANARAERAGAH